MTRLVGLIVYNWPLKLMAVALATLLYAGLVVSQNAQSHDVNVPIHGVNQQAQTRLIGSLGEVTQISYFVTDQSSVTITSANFTATVDLSQITPSQQAQSARVVVESADPRIQVLSVTPAFASVTLEKVDTKEVPVVVMPGPVPSGLDIQPPTQSIDRATVRGAQSDIARVTTVRADVPIDASGIGIDRDFPMTPVDDLGEPVREVEVTPATVRVTMKVFQNRQTATVPIIASIVGNPAPGFQVAPGPVTLSSPTVTLQGDAVDLATVVNAPTLPVSVEGRTSDLDVDVGFDLPTGVSAVKPSTVHVHVAIRAVTASRDFSVGIVLVGARSDRTCALSIQQATVTLGGSPVDLDRLTGATLSLTANVAGLDVGVHQVPLTITVQGLTLIAVSPPTVTVTITAATPSATPSAPASAPASPAASGGG